jgi:hypothetical protein
MMEAGGSTAHARCYGVQVSDLGHGDDVYHSCLSWLLGAYIYTCSNEVSRRGCFAYDFLARLM